MIRLFIGFGKLAYIEPEEAWENPWRPVCRMKDTVSNKEYDIVTDGKGMYKYTNM